MATNKKNKPAPKQKAKKDFFANAPSSLPSLPGEPLPSAGEGRAAREPRPPVAEVVPVRAPAKKASVEPSGPPEEPRVKVQILLPKSLHKELRLHCFGAETSIQELLQTLIAERLDGVK